MNGKRAAKAAPEAANKSLLRKIAEDTKGMTLIDMAIALAVIGLLTAPLMQAYHDYRINLASGNTGNHLLSVKSAIAQYYYAYGHYPCPARFGAAPGDADYGLEPQRPEQQNPPQSENPALCDAFETAVGETLAGAVPFKTLKIPVELSLDAWGNKLTYIVTKDQVFASSFTKGGGNIKVEYYIMEPDPVTGEMICTPKLCSATPGCQEEGSAGDAHYVLISHGMAGIGAYSEDGAQAQACKEQDPTLESENCDYDADREFFARQCAAGDEDDAGYYDDFLETIASAPTKPWVSAKSGTDLFSEITNIGINNPDPEANIDVLGNIVVKKDPGDPSKEGKTKSRLICSSSFNGDNEPEDCMPPAAIGAKTAEEAVITCEGAGSSAASGIGGNKAHCNVTLPGAAATGCNEGEVMYGLDSQGAALCKPL